MIKKYYDKFKDYCLKDKRVFAKGMCFDKLFFIFMIGCIVGVYYEQILTLVKNYLADGSIVWESRQGVIYGPFNPLYGAGAALMTALLVKEKRPWYMTLLYGALIGGGFEYVISWLQEIFVGTISWNYTGYFLNIGGRTTIPFMLVWGGAGTVFAYGIYPYLSRMIEKIPYNLGKLITKILVVFMALNMLISWTALLRQTMRRNGHEPLTPVGKIYDEIYTDEYLKVPFPNMVPVTK